MESGRGHGGVIRGGPGGKKMRKRKELDALVGGVGTKRANGSKRPGSGGISPQDQLLSESTGEEEYWSSTKGPGGKERRHYSGPSGKRQTRACTALLRLCTILLVMACVVATVTVMWLFIDIKQQTTYLRSQLDQVSAGNEGIPEKIHKCHSLTKQLENNQSTILDQLKQVSQRLANFSNTIGGVQAGLLKVEKKLNDSPELVSNPKDIKDLKNSVASFGSQIAEFQSTANQLKEEQNKISTLVDHINMNLTQFYSDLEDLKKRSIGAIAQSSQQTDDNLMKTIVEITLNITTMNKTLGKKLQYLWEDQNKSQKDINDIKENSQGLNSQIQTHLLEFKDFKSNVSTLFDQSASCLSFIEKNSNFSWNSPSQHLTSTISPGNSTSMKTSQPTP